MAFPCFGDAGVFLVVLVSLGAVGFPSLFVVLAFGVFAGADDFHMLWVAADPVAAEVV